MVINWYRGTEEDRALVRMWRAFGLPIEFKITNLDWQPLLLSVSYTNCFKVVDPDYHGTKFDRSIQFRLKPDES